jgi:hypothetical protein
VGNLRSTALFFFVFARPAKVCLAAVAYSRILDLYPACYAMAMPMLINRHTGILQQRPPIVLHLAVPHHLMSYTHSPLPSQERQHPSQYPSNLPSNNPLLAQPFRLLLHKSLPLTLATATQSRPCASAAGSAHALNCLAFLRFRWSCGFGRAVDA